MEKKYPCILIDDQIEDLELMRSILAGSSLLRVTQAFRKFEEAEAYLREESNDLIVSDIELLQDNQLVYNCLHELPAGIPICLVSGYPVFAARSFSYVRDNPDVIGILNKPFTPPCRANWKRFSSNTSNTGIRPKDPPWKKNACSKEPKPANCVCTNKRTWGLKFRAACLTPTSSWHSTNVLAGVW